MPTNCLSVFDQFMELALKGLIFGYGSSKIFTMSPNENAPDIFRGYFQRVPTDEKTWLLNNTRCFAGQLRKPPDDSIVLACENNHKFTIYFQIKLHENGSCIINQNNLWYLLFPHNNFIFKLHTHAHYSKLKQKLPLTPISLKEHPLSNDLPVKKVFSCTYYGKIITMSSRFHYQISTITFIYVTEWRGSF